MRLRKLLVLLVAVGVGIGATACDLLDISPEQSLSNDAAFENQTAAQSAVNGMYDGLQQNGIYGGFFVPMADFTMQNAVFSGSFTTWQDARDYNLIASHGPSLNMWGDHYDAINRANNVITRAPGLVDAGEASQDFVDQAVAQAKFVRALSHFNLVRLYSRPYSEDPSSPGVPVVTTPTEEPGEPLNVGRGTVQQVYDQIITDLQDAQSAAPSGNSGYRASSEAATALLAKVRLYQEQYGNALDLAEQVIDSYPDVGSISLEQMFGGSNPGSSQGAIFAIKYSATDNTGVNDHPSSFYNPSDLGGRGDITVNSDLVSIIEEGDVRGPGGLMYEYDGSLWTDKWNSPNEYDDAVVLRLGEIYLIAAEAAARTGDGVAAREYLNAVRARAGASLASSSLSGQALIDEIIQERRIELAFEGDRRHDALRLGRALQSNTLGQPAPENQEIFPIPTREIDVNNALSSGDQNPGY